MYRIISVSDGSEIGVVDAVNYIKVGESGSYTNHCRSHHWLRNACGRAYLEQPLAGRDRDPA